MIHQRYLQAKIKHFCIKNYKNAIFMILGFIGATKFAEQSYQRLQTDALRHSSRRSSSAWRVQLRRSFLDGTGLQLSYPCQ